MPFLENWWHKVDLGVAGRVALVLGSTSGLGRATAQQLADEGGRVAFCGRRGDVADELAAAFPGCAGFTVDLVDPRGVPALTEQVRERLGPIEILVLNSGGPAPGPATEIARDDLDTALQAVLFAQIAAVRAVLPEMTARGWGRIVAIGSSGVQQPIAQLARSNVARSALAAYLKSLATQVASAGITVNMVIPGRIDTERIAQLDAASAARTDSTLQEVRARSEATIPVGRYGRPDEFAGLAAFLCSDRASYLTGAQYRCDGGMVTAL